MYTEITTLRTATFYVRNTEPELSELAVSAGVLDFDAQTDSQTPEPLKPVACMPLGSIGGYTRLCRGDRSLQDVADNAKVSRSRLWELEQGRHQAPFNILVRIHRELGADALLVALMKQQQPPHFVLAGLENYRHIGLLLEEQRKLQKVSREELARRVNSRAGNIYKMERLLPDMSDPYSIRLTTLQPAFRALGVYITLLSLGSYSNSTKSL